MTDGFLIVDKEKGWTSHDVVNKARGILGIRKIGHLGTLDPNATGVLVLVVGKATKLVASLIGCDKEYEAEITLGKVSDTFDAEGIITSKSTTEISLRDIELALPEFRGTISQIPPIFSAIKIGGKKAYELARKGKVPELKPRSVTIDRLDIMSYEWPILHVLISCSSGTYIRSLANDIGIKMGCGGYLSNLRRTRVGDFYLHDAKKITEISKEYIVPISSIVNSNNDRGLSTA